MDKVDRKTEVIWIVASQVVLVAVNFFLLKLMTSRMSVESFGYYTLYMTIILFSRQILCDPISIVVSKDCASSGQHLRGVPSGFEIVRFLTDRLGYGLLLFGILLWVLACVALDSSIGGAIMFFCLVYLCANGTQGIYFNILNSIRQRKSAALFSILDSVFKLVLVFLVFRFFGNDLIHALIPVAAGAWLVSLGVRRYVRVAFPANGLADANFKPLVKICISLSVPLYLPTVLGAFKNVADRWILAAFIGVDELAAFNVLLQIGYFPMLMLVGVVQTFVAPRMYALAAVNSRFGRDELKKFLYMLMFAICLLAIVGCGMSFFLADWIFQVLVGKVYGVFSKYLPYFIVSGAFAATGAMLHLAVIGVFETRVVGKLMAASVVVGIVSVSFSIVTWGFVGAIAGLVATSFSTAIIYWLALNNYAFRFAEK